MTALTCCSVVCRSAQLIPGRQCVFSFFPDAPLNCRRIRVVVGPADVEHLGSVRVRVYPLVGHGLPVRRGRVVFRMAAHGRGRVRLENRPAALEFSSEQGTCEGDRRLFYQSE